MKRFTLRQAFALAAVACCTLSSSIAFAGLINYGDFGPDPAPAYTMYLDVRESSGTDPIPPGRYGAPNLIGNNLFFEPTNFVSQANNSNLNQDTTDVQLNYTLMAQENDMGVVAGGFSTLLINEAGDYSLTGVGTAATNVLAGLSVRVNILEVDGVPVGPLPSIFATDFVLRDLANDGFAMVEDWSNGVLIDLGAALVANNIPFEFGVTKATVAINNQLQTFSEVSSQAFIAKKLFEIIPGTVPNPDFQVVPEPTTAVMLLALVAGAAGLRRFA